MPRRHPAAHVRPSRPTLPPRGHRRAFELGAQSLEWLALSSFVVTSLAAATAYARGNLGPRFAELIFNNVKTFAGQ